MLVNLSGKDDNLTHLVYRAKYSPVPDDVPLIEINEHDVAKRLLTKTGERLSQRGDAPQCFYAEHLFEDVPAPQVYIDGVPAAASNVALFPKERMIRILGEEVVLGSPKVITMDYQYFVSVIEDNYTNPQIGVTFLGTKKHLPTGLNPPNQVTYTFDKTSRALSIAPHHDGTPEELWYRIRHRDEVTGKISEPSIDQKIAVSPNTFDMFWRLEGSKDGGKTWNVIDRIPLATGSFVLTSADVTENPHAPLTSTLTALSPTSAEIRIKNPWYMWELNTRYTQNYRIRSEDTDGEVSKYKEFGQAQMNFKPTKLRIRRKEDNGNMAQYDGQDAFTFRDITERDVDVTQPELVIVDDHLVAGRKYSYTFYIDDEMNLRSAPFMGIVSLPSP
jgi:hypothetical protein